MDSQMAQKIMKRFIGLGLEQRKVYLQRMLQEGVSPANLPIPQVRLEAAALPLSYAQERQWFLWQLDPHSAAYHIPSALRLKGRLDIAALQKSFEYLIARHESLRTRFRRVGEVTQQAVLPGLSIVLAPEEVDEGHLKARIEQDCAALRSGTRPAVTHHVAAPGRGGARVGAGAAPHHLRRRFDASHGGRSGAGVYRS